MLNCSKVCALTFKNEKCINKVQIRKCSQEVQMNLKIWWECLLQRRKKTRMLTFFVVVVVQVHQQTFTT